MADNGDVAPTFPNFCFGREFLVKHIKDILAFYEPRARDEDGGCHQSFMIYGTRFNHGFWQLVSSTGMAIDFMLEGKLLGWPAIVEFSRHGLEYLEKHHYIAEKDAYAFKMRDHEPDDMTQQFYGYDFVLAAHGRRPACRGEHKR